MVILCPEVPKPSVITSLEFKTTLMTVSEKVNAVKKNRDRFSISFDESTSAKNRPYMNLNLHDRQSFQSLGMIRVKASMKSQKTIELIQGRFAKFNLNLDTGHNYGWS